MLGWLFGSNVRQPLIVVLGYGHLIFTIAGLQSAIAYMRELPEQDPLPSLPPGSALALLVGLAYFLAYCAAGLLAPPPEKENVTLTWKHRD